MLGLSDDWLRVMSGGQEDLPLVEREYKWLLDHSKNRNYMMVMMYDLLDDDIPF